jgi:carboxyl-terminal processing protease
MKIKAFLTIILLILAPTVFGQKKRPKTPNIKPRQTIVSPEKQRRIDSFNEVWQTVDATFFDRTFGGVDWKKVKTEFLPRVQKANNDTEFHTLLQEMINRLNRSHFLVIPPEIYAEIERTVEATKKKKEVARLKKETEIENTDENELDEHDIFDKYGLGLDVRILNSEVVITKVNKDSTAEKAGLRSGFIIEKINGVSLKDFLLRLHSYPVYGKIYKNQLPQIVLSFFEDDEPTDIEVSYLDEQNLPKNVLIKREGLPGEMYNIISNLPSQRITFESRSLDDQTGYIKFNFFALPIMEKFCSAVTEFKKKSTVIVDLRGNLGGSLGILMAISGLLTDQRLKIGMQVDLAGTSPLFANPHSNIFLGKLVFLVDSHSISAAEIFAAAFKDNKRATIVGEQSAGLALPSVTKILSTGAIFQFPISDFITPSGSSLEGKGVEPDVIISLDRKSLLEGKDKQLEAAKNITNYKKPVKPELKVYVDEDDEPAPPPTPTPKPVIFAVSQTPKPLPPVSSSESKNKYDERALAIISESITALGGESELRKVNSIDATGLILYPNANVKVEGKFRLLRKSPNKYAEITYLDAIGELRESFDGKSYVTQSIFQGVFETKDAFIVNQYLMFVDFYEILRMKELYKNITFRGQFQTNGKLVNLIEATSNEGVTVAFAFDSKTKLLATRSSNFIDTTFDNYQKTGNILYPMTQSKSSIIKITLNNVKLNSLIADSEFGKRENCFTKID